MSAEVIIRDAPLRKLMKDIEELRQLTLAVGIQGDEAHLSYGNGATVSEVAFWQEFGTIDIPARSWLRSAMHENASRIARHFERELARVVEGDKSPVAAFKAIGFELVLIVQRKILSGGSPLIPNAPATVAMKGFNQPLVETMQLHDSVTYRVLKGGAVLAEGP